MIVHPIPPVYNEYSTLLILGSFPSVKSREENFFYGHKKNRFWKVVSWVFDSEEPETVEEKKAFLLEKRIALWDVIASCDIEGSSDSSIKNVIPNDISVILDSSKIKRIFVNGKAAEKYYNKYIMPCVGIKAICLPSTSPANAAWSLQELICAWMIIKE
ncbi:MAG: DNA-deoxyinosine glycosylase [Clostridia bacterium]|nr:DNA-deoxyinosine glycosylase [Clostridia bacterium]